MSTITKNEHAKHVHKMSIMTNLPFPCNLGALAEQRPISSQGKLLLVALASQNNPFRKSVSSMIQSSSLGKIARLLHIPEGHL